MSFLTIGTVSLLFYNVLLVLWMKERVVRLDLLLIFFTNPIMLVGFVLWVIAGSAD